MDNAAPLPPWIDPQELEGLMARFPGLEAAVIVEALVQNWPVRADVEAQLSAAALLSLLPGRAAAATGKTAARR